MKVLFKKLPQHFFPLNLPLDVVKKVNKLGIFILFTLKISREICTKEGMLKLI